MTSLKSGARRNEDNVKVTLLVVAAALGMGACSYRPPPVPLRGTPSAISALAGEWLGEYSSSQTGRSGSILLRLAADADTAYGDVLMTDRSVAGASQSENPPGRQQGVGATQLLRVAFISVGDRRISGALQPYRDPDCGCEVKTTFNGVLDGDAVSGTFETRHADGVVRAGRWNATRKARPPSSQ